MKLTFFRASQKTQQELQDQLIQMRMKLGTSIGQRLELSRQLNFANKAIRRRDRKIARLKEELDVWRNEYAAVAEQVLPGHAKHPVFQELDQ